MWLKKGNDHYEYLELGMFLLPIHRDSVEFQAFEIISLIQEKQEAAAELDESMEVVEGGED